jgi:conjugal transfer pilus assembly protein TraB
MTGVQAGTASVSQQNPSPILMRIQGNAQLAGSAEYDLRSCFMTGTSYGDARTHRAKIDIASISCVDKDNNLVLEETLTGYIADSDSIEGLRGTLREKRGAVLAKATLASMLESLGTAFSEAQGTAFDSVTGGGSVIEGDAALRSSGLSAAASGAKTLSDFYLQELERLFPVIEVPANRKAFAVITKGKALKWNDYGSLFVEKTQPL